MIKKYGNELGTDWRKLLNRETPVIVQIGAHDGVLGEEYGLHETLDELENFRLILVEPIDIWFSNLSSIYGKYKDKVEYEMHAISEIDGQIRMMDQGCMSMIDNNGDLSVFSKKWSTFIKDKNVSNIDLLLLDCEGYEFEIIKSINFDEQNISMIRYEFYHIKNKQECDEYLMSKGYTIELCYYDSISNKIAFKKNLI